MNLVNPNMNLVHELVSLYINQFADKFLFVQILSQVTHATYVESTRPAGLHLYLKLSNQLSDEPVDFVPDCLQKVFGETKSELHEKCKS